jgi:hypothetical protein
MKLAVHMRKNGIRSATLVVNHVPCEGPLGCDALVPVILPTGYTLTVYGTNGFVRRVGNHRTGLSSVDLCGQGLRKGGVLSSDDQSSTDKKGAAVMGKAIMSAFLAGFLLVSGGVAPGRAQAFDQVVNAPAATGMAAAAYTVFPQDRLRHPIEPYLSSGHPDSVTPGLSYQAPAGSTDSTSHPSPDRAGAISG